MFVPDYLDAIFLETQCNVLHFIAIIPVKRSSVLELNQSIKNTKRTGKVKNTIFRSAGFAYWFVGLIRFAQSAPNRS